MSVCAGPRRCRASCARTRTLRRRARRRAIPVVARVGAQRGAAAKELRAQLEPGHAQLVDGAVLAQPAQILLAVDLDDGQLVADLPPGAEAAEAEAGGGVDIEAGR